MEMITEQRNACECDHHYKNGPTIREEDKKQRICIPDDFVMPSGWISSNGEWYSCETANHVWMAYKLCRQLGYPTLSDIYDYKDYLKKEKGWVSLGEIIILERPMAFRVQVYPNTKPNHIQRVKLKRWLKRFTKYEYQLYYAGERIINQYDEFFQD